MEKPSNRLTFYYEDKIINFDLKLLGCRVPIIRCPTHEAVCLKVSPNMSQMSERRGVPLVIVLKEVYSFAKEYITQMLGIPDDVFIDVLERQSTGGYVVLKCPKMFVENKSFDF